MRGGHSSFSLNFTHVFLFVAAWISFFPAAHDYMDVVGQKVRGRNYALEN